jgi:hypothetical protein
MDHIPKASGGTATIGGWQAGPLLDPGRDENETEIGPLTENDAGPAMGEILELSLSAQKALEGLPVNFTGRKSFRKRSGDNGVGIAG